jgi:hypothetical protein
MKSRKLRPEINSGGREYEKHGGREIRRDGRQP